MNKRGYTGCPMTTYGYVLPGAVTIARWASRIDIKLSQRAKQRIKMIDWHIQHHKNISLTARHFGWQRRIVRKWLKRYDRLGIRGLADQSRKPHHYRQSQVPIETINKVIALRKTNPVWSKYKLAVHLKKDDIVISPSAIARLLNKYHLVSEKQSGKRKQAMLNPKKRYPRDLIIKEPGDLVQIDTKYLVGIGGIKLYQFTAIDVLTKTRILDVSTSISSLQGRLFLKQCQAEFPFVIKAVQTDNGAEFLKYFHTHCQTNRIEHYFIEVKSPKQNSYVERSHLTDEQEFYQLGNMRSTVNELKILLAEWQHKYNYIRPHQSLNYLTPMEYWHKYQHGRLPTKDYIPLQT